jgi:hypothetical protein
MREHFVVLSIGSGEVARAERPNLCTAKMRSGESQYSVFCIGKRKAIAAFLRLKYRFMGSFALKQEVFGQR